MLPVEAIVPTCRIGRVAADESSQISKRSSLGVLLCVPLAALAPLDHYVMAKASMIALRRRVACFPGARVRVVGRTCVKKMGISFVRLGWRCARRGSDGKVPSV